MVNGQQLTVIPQMAGVIGYWLLVIDVSPITNNQ
jgi:hypothetical protein